MKLLDIFDRLLQSRCDGKAAVVGHWRKNISK